MSSDHGAAGKHQKHKKHEEHEEHEEHVNHEAWVIPYADLLTLLLAMFLALFAAANAAAKDTTAYKEKLSQYAQAFAALEGGAGKENSILDGAGGETPVPAPGGSLDPAIKEDLNAAAADALAEKQQATAAQQREDAALKEIQGVIEAAAAQAGLGDKIGFRREERGLAVSVVSDQVLFASGDALLLPAGRTILDGIAPALVESGRPVMIEGHTDSRPISSARYASNWELSTARATQVLRYLQSRWALPPERLSASGYADTKPVVAGASEEAYARNRRVEIVILANG